MLATFLKSAITPADIPTTTKPQIAMLGRSNAGKSTLINRLAGVKTLARTSAKPGLTRTINLYDFDGRYLLVDLPGYGYSRGKSTGHAGFSRMISDYLSEAEPLKLVLLIVDARIGMTESDLHALKQLQHHSLPFVVVFNKIDKLSNGAAAQALRKTAVDHPDVVIIPHSSVSGKGLGELRDAIEKAVRAAASE